MNARLSIFIVPNLEFSPRPPFFGSQVVLMKGCAPAGEPGTPATALCWLQILDSSSFSESERISVRIRTRRCCVATVQLSRCVLGVVTLCSKGLYSILEIEQEKGGSYLFVPLNR